MINRLIEHINSLFSTESIPKQEFTGFYTNTLLKKGKLTKLSKI